tara:strand:+ start:134540 stop:134689 length:150 start_codon:yes stop_codon:yes gene_type:complete
MFTTVMIGALLFLVYILVEIITLKKEVRKISKISDYLLNKVKTMKSENK